MTTQAKPQYSVPDLHIAGRWRAGRAKTSSPVIDPATGEVLGRLSHASAQDLDDALRAVDKGFRVWSETPITVRQKILHAAVRLMQERAAAIAPLLTLEQGKPLAQSLAEIQGAATLVQWYAEQARRAYGRIIEGATQNTDIEVRKGPIGPCLLLSPWNMPVMLAARKIGGALAAGCSCILKPPEETPRAIADVVQCFIDAGVPEGVINLVYGIPAEISSKLIASDVIRKISFTGSVPVGKHLASLAAPGLKKLTLELGGHSPVIVMSDANLDLAVEQLALAKFRNAGQLCLAPTRFFVHRDVYSRFVEQFAARASSFRIGHGLNADTEMGPLANGRRLQAMQDLMEANAQSTRLVTGGKRVGSEGNFFSPTVLADAGVDAPAMRDEPFGPVALMTPFDSVEEVISRANETRYGLASYVYTDSAKAQKALLQGLDVGTVAINSTVASMAEAPFGGVKDSGYGHESGEEGLEGYLHTKTVHRTYI
ncbi:NAD-dependent succinate-semialdehyde dehydrogenase [Calothrix sp. FACHB-1219]|uniref:aldehyde dehydrogenase family protein n=1 Tax=Calothrix sp. FACHB-1219 TaxID=2692778 RepID=UPI001685D4B9|nr:NAD-dependent succinate-semialdehyde dehydrogenase [Calothrix sp. FACHB-1219]